MTGRSGSTRRDFLTGKAAVDAVAGRLAVPEDTLQSRASVGAGREGSHDLLLQVGRQAMACRFEIYFNAGQYEADTQWATDALDLVDQLEDQLSVYRDQSELSRINRQAATAAVPVESGLFGLLLLAEQIYRETDGAFDLTSGPLSQAWGFARRKGRIPSDDALQRARARVGGCRVRLDRQHHTIRFLEPGVEIHVNSIGKGYALDRCRAWLVAAGATDFLIHGGQSSVLASGSRAGRSAGGWSIGVRDPLRPGRRLAEVFLRDRALGTSGAGVQFFRHQGRRYGHLIDPRTGQPAAGVYASTVLAPTAAQADALATAFYVMGPAMAHAYCEKHPEIAMVMVRPGKKRGGLEIDHHGLGAEDWQLVDRTD